jgi:hypothetical protein
VADLNPHEDGLSYFIEPVHRERFRDSMRSTRRRAKLRDQLAHFRWLDQRYTDGAVPLDIDRITERLRSLGAPDTCFVVSEDEALDGREMPLDDAVRAVLWGDYGTLLSCVPGRLAFYCDEARLDMAILARPAPT